MSCAARRACAAELPNHAAPVPECHVSHTCIPLELEEKKYQVCSCCLVVRAPATAAAAASRADLVQQPEVVNAFDCVFLKHCCILGQQCVKIHVLVVHHN